MNDMMTGQVANEAVRGIIEVIKILLNISLMVVFLRVLLSWVSPDPRNPLVQGIYRVTDPAFRMMRRWFPWLSRGAVDLSPIMLVLLISLFSSIVLDTIAGYGSISGNLMRGFGMLLDAVLFLFVLIYGIRIVMILAGTSPYSPFYQAVYRLAAPLETRLVKFLSIFNRPPKPKSNGGNGNGNGNVTYLKSRPSSNAGLVKAAPWILLVISIVLYGGSSALVRQAIILLNQV